MWFLNNFPFRLESMDDCLPKELRSESTALGYLQLCREFMTQTAFFYRKIQKEIKAMTDIKSMYPQELSALMEALGEKAFGQSSFTAGCMSTWSFLMRTWPICPKA